jgi:Phytanoyl-CoA dioxygenase (PhyH)
MLTAKQTQQFKRKGVLLLRGFFTPRETAQWRQEVSEYFGQPKSSSDWIAAMQSHSHTQFRLNKEPTPSAHPKLAAAFASLNPGLTWVGENEIVLRPRHSSAEWSGARAPHLDFPVGRPLRFLANTVIYLSEVQTHGGAFMYWPGSHLTAWKYFARHPSDYLSQGERSQDQTFAIITGMMKAEPVEFVGNAGDVIIWHHLLLHSPSINEKDATRMALFGRWGMPLSGDEEHFNFSDSMWQHWQFQPSEFIDDHDKTL